MTRVRYFDVERPFADVHGEPGVEIESAWTPFQVEIIGRSANEEGLVVRVWAYRPDLVSAKAAWERFYEAVRRAQPIGDTELLERFAEYVIGGTDA